MRMVHNATVLHSNVTDMKHDLYSQNWIAKCLQNFDDKRRMANR